MHITSKEVHVVLVDAARVVRDLAWDVLRISCGLHGAPSVIALHRVAAWAVQLIRIDFGKQLKVKLKQSIKTALSDVKATENVQLPIVDKTRVIAASVWLLAH